MPGTQAYIQVVREDDGHVLITMRNISARELEVSPEADRTVCPRGIHHATQRVQDWGLPFARSFVEVKGGTMKLEVEDDLFRVSIRWKMEETGGAGQEPGGGILRGSLCGKNGKLRLCRQKRENRICHVCLICRKYRKCRKCRDQQVRRKDGGRCAERGNVRASAGAEAEP